MDISTAWSSITTTLEALQTLSLCTDLIILSTLWNTYTQYFRRSGVSLLTSYQCVNYFLHKFLNLLPPLLQIVFFKAFME